MNRVSSNNGYPLLLMALAIVGLVSCKKEELVTIRSGNTLLKIDHAMHSKIEMDSSTALVKNFEESEYLEVLGGTKISNFKLKLHSSSTDKDHTSVTIVKGENPDGVQKIMTITTFNNLPDFFTLVVTYVNKGKKTYDVDKWVNHHYTLHSAGCSPDFFAFQGSSNSSRSDWIQKVDSAYYCKNYMGMNNSDYGGGIPMIDVWRKDVGMAIGHTSTTPQLVSLPIQKLRNDAFATIGIEYENKLLFSPNDTIKTLETFVTMHHGDCFTALQKYTDCMKNTNGLKFIEPEATAFEAQWCAWGYERNFTLEEIMATIPKVKELGIKWVTLDDGYQVTEGDWFLNKEKFPNGIMDVKKLTDYIHQQGLKAQIWWAPLAISPDSKLYRDHPNMLLRDKDYAPQFITWWDAWYMSPTDDEVLDHTGQVVKMFLKDWNFDGLKLDGQHMNCVLPDHAENHEISYPEQSNEKLPDFFHHIYNEAKKYKPNVLIQHCPCGTCMSYFNMATANQFVASDPLTSRQIRQKGKVYKALMPRHAYFGDHVELSDKGEDFASSFGVGAVLGTKFTYPKDNPSVKPGFLLTPDKEKKWKHWFGLYNSLMLSKGSYQGDLYDIGYDKPETHMIKKDNAFYYAFYADEWNGNVVFKGLNVEKKYTIYDYDRDKEIGMVTGKNPMQKINFKQYILLKLEEI
jgi:alpha-galactosidase